MKRRLRHIFSKNFHKLLVFIAVLGIVFTSCEVSSQYNSSNSDSSSSDDELIDVEEEVEIECPECSGRGSVTFTCSNCGGSGEKYHHVSGTRPKACGTCYGTGKVRCEKCGGYGYTSCQYCNGQGSFRCTVCKGYGRIIIDPSRPHLAPQCNNCDGTGYERCRLCEGHGRMTCCNNGMATCPTCWGSGAYGQENYSDSYIEECPSCEGEGRYESFCRYCNGTGEITVKQIVQKKKSEL